MMGNYLKGNNVKIKDGTDVNSIMRDMMSIILEGALDQEMDEELGYSKYDYRNKETDNSRNGHSQKTMHTSYGDMEIDIPRDRKGEFEPQIIKKYQNTITQDMKRFVKCFFELLTQIIVKVRKCKVQRVCVLHFQLAGSGGCFFLRKLYH